MALPNFSFPHIYGLPKYIHLRKWSLFLPVESGLIPWLLWPFRRLENPRLELETSASSLLECSFLGFSLLGTHCHMVRCPRAMKKPMKENWVLWLTAPSVLPADRQCHVPATWVRHFGCSSLFEPSRCPLSQPTSHGAEESPNHA